MNEIIKKYSLPEIDKLYKEWKCLYWRQTIKKMCDTYRLTDWKSWIKHISFKTEKWYKIFIEQPEIIKFLTF